MGLRQQTRPAGAVASEIAELRPCIHELASHLKRIVAAVGGEHVRKRCFGDLTWEFRVIAATSRGSSGARFQTTPSQWPHQ
jgi:hypothetical protein